MEENIRLLIQSCILNYTNCMLSACYADRVGFVVHNVSTNFFVSLLDQLIPLWIEQIHIFMDDVFRRYADIFKYSCYDRCGAEQRNASVTSVSNKHLPRCYCDKLCDDFGDCCFDFDAL